MDSKTIGLYLHIPFCYERCNYCAFYSELYERNMFNAFLDALMAEINLRSDETKESVVDSVFIGGGTPSLLSGNDIEKIIKCIKGNFTLSHSSEITVESNPESLTKEFASAALNYGVNRISIGVQSLSDEELKTLGRIHTSQDALRAINVAREFGFENIGIDLIFGIPGQTLERWMETLKNIVQSGVKHISTYSLTYEEGTKLSRSIEEKKIIPPCDEVVSRMYLYSKDYLESMEFTHYEISNFALPGFQCRSHLNTWNGGVYMGFGPSAHSFDGSKRSWNASDLKVYMEALNKGNIPLGGSERLNDRDKVLEKILLGFRQVPTGVPVRVLKELSEEDLDVFISEGLLEIYEQNCKEPHARLTREGLLLADSIIEAFDI